MNIFAICALAAAAAVMYIAIKPRSGEIALMLALACAAIIFMSALSEASDITATVSLIIAKSGISTSYTAILLKVMGICLITEFAVNTCKDSGSLALAGSVSLAGKIMITVVSLPLYGDILNAVISIVG